MQELSITSILSLFETNKQQRQSFVSNVLKALDDGTANPLKVHLHIKSMDDIIKQLNDNKTYKDLLLTSFKEQSAGQKNFEYYNSKFEQKEVGTKYDYSNCNDPELLVLQEAATNAANELKARQEFLKTIPTKGIEIVEKTTGEMLTIYPPSKTSTTSVAVTLK